MNLRLNWRENSFQENTWNADFEHFHLMVYKLPVIKSSQNDDIYGYFAFLSDGMSEENSWLRKGDVPQFSSLGAAQEALEIKLNLTLYRLADYYADAWRNYNDMAD